LARDGKPKFDLSRYNPEYFERLRTRVRAAGERGIYVSIMLFEGHELENFTAWPFHPFEEGNNINGIDPDPCPGCDEIARQDLQVPASAGEDIEGLTAAHYGGAEFVGKGLSCLHPGNVPLEDPSAQAMRANEPMMAAEELAEVAVLMASQPAHINMLEAIVLPVGQTYLGRG